MQAVGHAQKFAQQFCSSWQQTSAQPSGRDGRFAVATGAKASAMNAPMMTANFTTPKYDRPAGCQPLPRFFISRTAKQ
jgi:hypothetical protein